MAEEVPTDNPAGRLYKILNQTSSSDPGWTILQVLSGALAVSPVNSIEFCYALYQFANLIQDTETAISRFTDFRYRRYLKTLVRIRTAFEDIDYQHSWSEVRKYLNDETLLGLKSCAVDLSGTEVVIEEVSLKELQAEVESLLEKVIEFDNLEKEIKSLLFEKLHEILNAIRNYRFYGSTGLRHALETSIGAGFINRDQIKEQKENLIVNHFLNVLVKIDSMLSPLVKVKQLLPAIQHFFGQS